MPECFLSGLDHTQALLHHLVIHDTVTNDIDTAYVSDECWRIICKEDDEVAASFWVAYKQAISAGYSDVGFVSDLRREMKDMGIDLFAGVDSRGYGSFFVAVTPPISQGAGQLRLWCRSRVAIPPRIMHSVEKNLRVVPFSVDWEWIDERWLIATLPSATHKVERAQQPWNEALYKLAQQNWGTPPDIFAYIANAETLVGYEIIRRALL